MPVPPVPETETAFCYGDELLDLCRRLEHEGPFIAALDCDRRHYTCEVRPKPAL